LGKSNLKYAWILDKLANERELGQTVSISMEEYQTEKCFFSVINGPGNPKFVKNMITGIT